MLAAQARWPTAVLQPVRILRFKHSIGSVSPSSRPVLAAAVSDVRERQLIITDPNVASLDNGNPNKIGLQDLLHNDGGPPRFVSPFVAGLSRSPPAQLPFMLYLPGIDGTGLAASRQFPYLLGSFDLRALTVPPHDRTSFEDLMTLIEDYLAAEVDACCPPERPVYLLGESFGAVLALALAARRPDLVDRIVLVNPATSFQRSAWPVLGPLLPMIPKELYPSLPVALAPILGNPLALAAFGIQPTAPLPEQAAALAQGMQNLLPQLTALADILPPPTLAWKLQLLAAGNAAVSPHVVQSVQQRVLLLVGDRDWLIPSEEEGKRLAKLLPRCRLQVLPGRSHALLQEAGVNLVDLMQAQGFYVARRRLSSAAGKRSKHSFGQPVAVELPTSKELHTTSDSTTAFIRKLVSPVFFSTDPDGRVSRGLGGVPAAGAGPLLFVGNHQTYALDTGVMIEEFVRERGMLLRGLAHPVVFGGMQAPQDSSAAAAEGRPNQLSALMSTFGAVPVGGRNFFRLLQQGEAVLLFPGGVREAYKRKGEAYKLFWNDKAEFVRMAARFGATIVPFAAIGSEDGFQMVADGRDILALPLIGKFVERRVRESIPVARRGVAAVDGLEGDFIQPLSLPKAPERYYYLFQQPIATCPNDLKEPGRCTEIYRRVQGEVESGIRWLQLHRKQDPYRELLPRTLYELAWGGKQAPTFPLH